MYFKNYAFNNNVSVCNTKTDIATQMYVAM